MTDQDLVRMANQIAEFFTPYSEDEAVQGIAEHIRSFWEPRMRAALTSMLDSDPSALKPIVIKAAEQLRTE